MTFVPNLAGTTPTDVKLDSPNRTIANNAALAGTTPLYAGETIVTVDNGLWFRMYGPLAGQWAARYRR